ncbi:MAG: 2-dehydropantoate 2-reductase N-terminal domain-containing protein, partial [Candidatus Hydrogenedentota bacterium]
MRITILGAGSWGLCLCVHLFKKGERDLKVFELFENKVQEINKYRENKDALPGIKIPKEIQISSSLYDSIKETELLICAMPSFEFHSMFDKLSKILKNDVAILNVAKGFTENGLRLSEVIRKAGYKKIAVLSGPSHAEEVSKNIPAAVVVASTDAHFAKEMQTLLSTDMFRVYT